MGEHEAPIATRLTKLGEQWRTFAEHPQLRVMHWVIEADEWRMLDTFFTLESLDSAETDDVFLRAEVPFADVEHHGLALHRWLVDAYADSRAALEQAGLVVGWLAPTPDPRDDIGTLLATLESLWLHHQPLVRHLVLVLEPKAVASTKGWLQWIERLVPRLVHPNLRIVVFDHREHAALAGIARSRADRVHTSVAALDMPAAYLELSQRAGGLDTPAGAFRHAFVQMSVELSRGRIAEARGHGERASAVAHAQKWSHLEFAVVYAEGSGHLSAGDHGAAIRCYRSAERIAAAAQRDGESFALGLRLKARIAIGAAAVAAGAFGVAAQCYEDARPLADELGDHRMQLECWRMAAYCHEQNGTPDRAWTCGTRALAVGTVMPDEERRSSSLAAAGEAMLRLAATPRRAGSAPAIDGRMRELLGQKWRELARPAEHV